MRWLVAAMVVLVSLAGCGDKPVDGNGDPIERAPESIRAGVSLNKVADGFARPLLVTHAGDERLFVVEQEGGIWMLDDDDRKEVLDLANKITTGSERGLLGLAFDPEDNRRAFVSYTGAGGASILSRFAFNGQAMTGETVLMQTAQPALNHNGGHILFGPDGYLYYGLGDGGGFDDQFQNGQNKATVLGTIMRLDVSGPTAEPAAGNPFLDDATGDDRIWSYGLRNPWRFSFDAGGNLWIGDVGQNAWEEINRAPAKSTGAENYGWPAYEGTHQYRGVALNPVMPVAEYANQGADCAVTGGHVGRDPGVPELNGIYVFGDFCSGRIYTLRADGIGWDLELLEDTNYNISSFGEDNAGRLYLVNLNGDIYRFE